MRLFVAFELPLAHRRALERLAQAGRAGLPRARWVRAESLHLSLLFLGEVAAERVADLDRELTPVFADCPPFTFRWTAPGSFPTQGAARVLWAGLETDGELGGLQTGVTAAAVRALRGQGSADNRPYHPHVTLARCDPPWPGSVVAGWRSTFALSGVLHEPFIIKAGTLFASELRPDGAHYQVVSTYPLRGDGCVGPD